MIYSPNKYYDTRPLTIQQKRQLIIDAKQKCIDYQVDILDCTTSFRRKKIEMSFEDAFKKFTKKHHFTSVIRYPSSKLLSCAEIEFNTKTDHEYFLQINLKPEVFKEIMDEYNLKEWKN